MIKNNWITTSLSNRTPSNLCDFTLTINPYEFTLDTFENNSNRVANELANSYENIHIFYSGGLDSEYVMKTFIQNDLKFTTVFILTPYNKKDLSYAINFLEFHNIKPVVYEYDESEMLRIMMMKCVQTGYFSFISGIQLDVCDKISDNNGSVLLGAGEPFTPPERGLKVSEWTKSIDFCEFEFYVHYHPGNHIGGFYSCDLALHYSMLQEAVYTGDIQRTKSNLYGLPYRKKLFWDEKFFMLFNKLKINIERYEISAPYDEYLQALVGKNSVTFR